MHMKLPTWKAKDIKRGTKVLLRLDVNVPVKGGKVEEGGEFGRITQALPEVDRLLARGACVILAAHLGDPGGEVNKKLSLAPVAKVLAERLQQPVPLVKNFEVPELKPGTLCMLENLRFDPGEEKNSGVFASKLASIADVYVNNAFGVCHRKHASVHAITSKLPSFAGELLVREIAELQHQLKQPFVLIMGGAKIQTKIGMLHKLGPMADKILIGGGLAVTFLAAANVDLPTYPTALIGSGDVTVAKKLLKKFVQKIVLPVDLIAKPKQQIVSDIGPDSQAMFSREIMQAKSIIWNGPMGIIERNDGTQGTLAIAQAIKNSKARAITGGGETVDFLDSHDLIHGFAHVSTGGGAMLAFLGGEKLPGLEALRP